MVSGMTNSPKKQNPEYLILISFRYDALLVLESSFPN